MNALEKIDVDSQIQKNEALARQISKIFPDDVWIGENSIFFPMSLVDCCFRYSPFLFEQIVKNEIAKITKDGKFCSLDGINFKYNQKNEPR